MTNFARWDQNGPCRGDRGHGREHFEQMLVITNETTTNNKRGGMEW